MPLLLAMAGCGKSGDPVRTSPDSVDNALLSDASDGRNWPGYGRTYGEQHFSPLSEIDSSNISKLGLLWSLDLPPGNAATIPVAVDGVLYFAAGLSVVRAVDAGTGKLLWTYDPKVAEVAGRKMRQGWGSRGIGYWDGKVYVGTGDGRLIALDARNGKPVWSALTVGKDDGRYITGAPRLFDGKVIIGHGGADSADVRGYVTAYDAATGRQLWRFYTVPGNPANGFEDKAQEMAARTWSGQWWKYGDGGTVWNAMTYDADTDSILIGTGNGAPWNYQIRSEGKGDNLFLTSIVALDAKTGAYKWHYQINPGEMWDYNAAMDIHLAEIDVDGKKRKVAITAPKNGFLYVIDRTNGKLLSATPIARITWASGIDLKTGRPIEIPGARFPGGKDFEMWPSTHGAHSWTPSAYSPQTGLVYIPVMERGYIMGDRGVDPKNWKRPQGFGYDLGINIDFNVKNPLNDTSWLVAFDPVAKKQVWRLKTYSSWNGGVMATGGNLVFQGQLNNQFVAYEAKTGARLWNFDAQAPVISAPISYSVNGRQMVTVIVGMGSSVSMAGKFPNDYLSQPRRVLTFALGGTKVLPAARPYHAQAVDDPSYKPDAALEGAGMGLFFKHCAICHGGGAISGGFAPDLRTSSIPLTDDVFKNVLVDGALVSNGMPRFEELSRAERDALRQYIRSRTAALRNDPS
ncbi:MAG: PQQ-dependent dehydrogenase, methanol/ethanol family [Sphingobium sp.]